MGEMTDWARLCVIGVAFSLAACGGGVPILEVLPEGEESFVVSEGGMPFAEGSELRSDLEGEALTVKVARVVHEYDTGETRLLVTTEVVTFGPGGTLSPLSLDATLTLNDGEIVIVDGVGETANFQSASAYGVFSRDASGTVSLYSYTADPRLVQRYDMESAFVYGFETDPTMIDALTGTAVYRGEFDGYVLVLDETDILIGRGRHLDGLLAFNVDFSENLVSGGMAGDLELTSESTLPVYAGFEGADIVENGFSTSLEVFCDDGMICGGDSSLSAAFFGAEGEELTGLVLFDHTQTDTETGDGIRIMGPTSFSTLLEE